MKKIYFLLFAMAAFTANAQFEIDFDDMTLGDVSPQSPYIVLWPASGVTDAQVTNEQSFSGDQSIVMREQPGGTFDDILINLGNLGNNVWSVEWMMYIPNGKVGFWNVQENESASPAQWNGQFFAGLTGSGGIDGFITTDLSDAMVAYSSDEWFKVTHVIDLTNLTHTVDINGSLLLDNHPYSQNNGTPASQLGAINYYSIDGNNRYYIDDFKLIQGDALSTNDFEVSSFSVYPNPVKDILVIQSQEAVSGISIYDVAGKLVYQGAPNTVSPEVNMTNFNSGVYFVKVTIGNSSKTVKVIR